MMPLRPCRAELEETARVKNRYLAILRACIDRLRMVFYTGFLRVRSPKGAVWPIGSVSMVILVTLIHILISIFLIIVVLLQSGKAADLAGAFGGMGSQTAFGPRGAATVLSKATTIAAAAFMVTSLTLAIFATQNAGRSVSSVLDSTKPATQSAPAQSRPAPAPVQPAPAPEQPAPAPAQ
jgi:preprotein translocase subunit SecG